MSQQLRQYLYDNYMTAPLSLFKKVKKGQLIQIDDQDDTDNISEFCNIFVLVGSNNKMTVTLTGKFPITQKMIDFAEIYDGKVDKTNSRITFYLKPMQVESLFDFAMRIRETAGMGDSVGNMNWHKISARTISSLYRFVRNIKEYRHFAGLTVRS